MEYVLLLNRDVVKQKISQNMFTLLQETVNQSVLKKDITEERKKFLKPLINYIQEKVDNNKTVNINFICTHNSRRSHLSQIWAQVAAEYYEINNVCCYSGGTEATAMFPKIAETLEKQGFGIWKLSHSVNPVYAVKFAEDRLPLIAFSKKYDDTFNPVSSFAAVMTCSQADGACPFIPGAELRTPVKFEDPKIADNTPAQDQIYAERSIEIAAEMFYVFSQIK